MYSAKTIIRKQEIKFKIFSLFRMYVNVEVSHRGPYGHRDVNTDHIIIELKLAKSTTSRIDTL